MITIKRTFNPSGLLQVDDLRGEVFTGESGAHIFEISGVGVQLAGTVKGTFLAANDVMTPLTGSAADGVVSLTLTEDCYAAPGRFILSIYLSNGNVTECIYCGVGNVFRTQSDVISYPSASIPDIEQIIANAQAAAAQIQAEVTAAQAAVAAAQTAVDGIEAQKDTMIASIASVAGQGTDTTLTQSGVAADAKATGDEVSALKSVIDNVDNTLIYGGELPLTFSWENGVINASYQEVNNTNPSQARTVGYYSPKADIALKIDRVNVNAIIVVVYAADGTPVSRMAYLDSTTPFYLQLEAGKKYRFCVTAEENVDLHHMESNVVFSLPILTNAIGVPQLTDDLASVFAHLADTFGSSPVRLATGITATKNSNEISWTVTANSAYAIYTTSCQSAHKYALYYDITGTYTNGNYEFDIKLFNQDGSSWISGANVGSISQTTGADASGVFTFTVPTGYTAALGFDITNKSGQTVAGSFYLYDVTGLTESQISGIDFSQVGVEKTIVLSGGSASSYDWTGKKVVFYGDSITAQNKYPVMVQNYYHFDMVNASVGGARISYRGSGDTDMSADSRLEALPSDADVVVIMGGTNDWGKVEIEQTLTYNNGFDRTKFKGGLAYIIQKIQARCPNATLIIATLIGGRNETRAEGQTPIVQYLPEADRYGQTDIDFRNAEIEVANLLNIQVCDTWSCGINGNNACTIINGVVTAGTIADTVHPTTAGAELIANYIIGYFNAVYVD